jgi:hypothetical protein
LPLLQVIAPVAPSVQARRPLAAVAIQWGAATLDVTIGCCVVAVLIIVATGGVDLGWVSMTRASRPFLVLCVLLPIRLAQPGPSWLERSAWLRAVGARAGSVVDAHVSDGVRDVAFAFVVSRIGAVAIGFFVNLLFPPDRPRPWQLPFDKATLAETFAAWDSGWYFDIASRGYYYSATGESSVAFFPLYPMTMRMLAWPFGSSDAAIWSAGVGISMTCFLAGLLVLHDLTMRLLGDRDVARRTVLYLSVFPFSFFLSRVYPSGLFLLLTVLAISLAVRSRWGWAGVCGALATLTRPQGILILVPLALMAARGGGRDAVFRLARLAPVPLAFLGFHVYIGFLSGEPLAWSSSEDHWDYSIGNPPWEQLLGLLSNLEQYGPYAYFTSSDLAPYQLFHGVIALFLLACVPTVFTRLGGPLGCYVLASLLVPLSGNALSGIGRYGAVLFPVFMMLATIKSRRVHEALLIIWSLFLALFVGLFVTWHPIY